MPELEEQLKCNFSIDIKWNGVSFVARLSDNETQICAASASTIVGAVKELYHKIATAYLKEKLGIA